MCFKTRRRPNSKPFSHLPHISSSPRFIIYCYFFCSFIICYYPKTAGAFLSSFSSSLLQQIPISSSFQNTKGPLPQSSCERRNINSCRCVTNTSSLVKLNLSNNEKETPLGKSGANMILDEESFHEIILSASKPVLIFFSAPWCGPCRLTNKVVREVMELYDTRIDVYELCTDDLPDIAADVGVVSIPTIQIFYEEKVYDTVVGCVAKNVLANFVSTVLEDISPR